MSLKDKIGIKLKLTDSLLLKDAVALLEMEGC